MNIDPSLLITGGALAVGAGLAIGKLMRGDKTSGAAIDGLRTKLEKIETDLAALLLAFTRTEHHGKSIERLDAELEDLNRDFGRLRERLDGDVAKLRQRLALVEQTVGIIQEGRSTPVQGIPIIPALGKPTKPPKDDD
jgi:chromosome segregation ATPase